MVNRIANWADTQTEGERRANTGCRRKETEGMPKMPPGGHYAVAPWMQ
jgi:hypothetical protein